jgi:L-ascorbate metabolism protein UlaG (beta-lactamase superfamily)
MAGNGWIVAGSAIEGPAAGADNGAMKITQLRNATAVIEFGPHKILVDPMLAPKGALPPLKLFGERTRNPIVELPPVSGAILESVTHCLITHCQKGHFDHLDRAAKAWLRRKQIPVICTPHDEQHLRQRGLNVMPLAANHHEPQPFFEGRIRTVRCRHGRGLVSLMMEHGVGYFIEMPGEPSLYLSGDTILTPDVLDFLARHQPDVCLVPAGGAKFDLGHEIIMGIDEVLQFAGAAQGIVVANHLEALSHCPVQRSALREQAQRAGLAGRVLVPADGESLDWPATYASSSLRSSS